jgi:hypothetical protein
MYYKHILVLQNEEELDRQLRIMNGLYGVNLMSSYTDNIANSKEANVIHSQHIELPRTVDDRSLKEVQKIIDVLEKEIEKEILKMKQEKISINQSLGTFRHSGYLLSDTKSVDYD